MARYAVGDLQGCAQPFDALLERLPLQRGRDRLWLVGDLVNRGPASLAALRRAKALDPDAVTVLGNHDVLLLAMVLAGVEPKGGHTLQEVLDAPDRDELVAWLRERPLLHRDDDHVLVHAGIHPRWSLAQAESLARDVEARLRGPDAATLLRASFEADLDRWDDALEGLDREKAALRVLTRMRCLDEAGRLLGYTGPLDEVPDGAWPWWRAPSRRALGLRVVFGHWAALGLHREPGVLALDSGCVYGRALTAVRLEDDVTWQVACGDGG